MKTINITTKIVLISIICATTMMSGCIESPEYGTGNSIEGSGDLMILNHSPERGDYGTLVVSGIAENTGAKSLIYAEIRVKFYDVNDALIDTSLDNINDLGSGEKWNFKVMYFGTEQERIHHYKIAVGSTL